MAVMGGRVIPTFTNNGIPGAKATRNFVVEKFALGSVLVLVGVASEIGGLRLPVQRSGAFTERARLVPGESPNSVQTRTSSAHATAPLWT